MDSIPINQATEAANPHRWVEQGNILRLNGEIAKATYTFTQAMVLFLEKKDFRNTIESLLGRLFCWKYKYNQTKDKTYARFMLSEAELMLSLAKEHSLKEYFYMSYYWKGVSAMLSKKYNTAIRSFNHAEKYIPDEFSKGNLKVYLGAAMYKNNKKIEGERLILEGIGIFKINSFKFPYLASIYLFKAYRNLAKLVQLDDLTLSRSYRLQAEDHLRLGIVNQTNTIIGQKILLLQFSNPYKKYVLQEHHKLEQEAKIQNLEKQLEVLKKLQLNEQEKKSHIKIIFEKNVTVTQNQVKSKREGKKERTVESSRTAERKHSSSPRSTHRSKVETKT